MTTSSTNGKTEQTSFGTTQVPPALASASSAGTLHTSSLESSPSTPTIPTKESPETSKHVYNFTTTTTEAPNSLPEETTSSSITYTANISSETITTIEATTIGKLCIDTLDCSVYSVKLVCSGEFLTWAYQHCSKYCGFCKETSTTSTKRTTTSISPSPPTNTFTSTTTPALVTTARDPSCQDVVNCAGLERKCGDVSEHVWLYQNCRRTCQMCQESPLCVDELHDCANLASLICDLGLNTELKQQCKKTCKLC